MIKKFFIIFYNHSKINTNISKILISIIVIFLYFIFKINITFKNYILRIAHLYNSDIKRMI